MCRVPDDTGVQHFSTNAPHLYDECPNNEAYFYQAGDKAKVLHSNTGVQHFSKSSSISSRAMTIRYRGTAFLKERINLKALKLLESCSRLACHCDALVFLFYRSHVSFDTNNLGELDDAGKI